MNDISQKSVTCATVTNWSLKTEEIWIGGNMAFFSFNIYKITSACHVLKYLGIDKFLKDIDIRIGAMLQIGSSFKISRTFFKKSNSRLI